MKKLLFLFVVISNTVYAQHMYREAGDNCVAGGQWYHSTTGVCYDDTNSSDRCDYCGLYFWSASEKKAHMAKCNYRPRIIFDYDNAGNRTKKESINYHWGRKIISYNESSPFDSTMKELMLSINPVAILIKKEEGSEESSTEGMA